MKVYSTDVTQFVSSNSCIAERANVPGIVFSLFLKLAGIALFVSVWLTDCHSSLIAMALIVTGTASMLWGVFRLFWQSAIRVYVPSGSVVREYSLGLDQESLDCLAECFERRCGDFPPHITVAAHGVGRMDVLRSGDGRFVAVQLFRQVAHEYVPVTSVCLYEGEDALKVSGFLSKSCRLS